MSWFSRHDTINETESLNAQFHFHSFISLFHRLALSLNFCIVL